MRHFLPQSAVILALLVWLAGCSPAQSPAQSADADAGSSAPSDVSVAEPAMPAGPVFLVPAKLDACEPGAVIVVHWDMRKTRPDITDVEIWTGPPGKQTLFAAGGYTGEASTGQPWGHPGTTFSVRNKADGAEVATASVSGPTCG